MDNWRKSSRSNGAGGECVEVASGDDIAVRDTTNRHGGTLAFTTDAWSAFLSGVRA